MTDNIHTIGGPNNNLEKEDNTTPINKFKNIKLYLNNTVGKRWVFAYINEDDEIVYFRNTDTNPSDTVFLAEFIKTMVFSGSMVVDEEEF